MPTIYKIIPVSIALDTSSGNSEEIKKLMITETELKTKIGQLEQNLEGE
jgi:hypothetical protein